MAKLTDKREKFVQELITGKSQREAYRSAYPKSKNWAESAVDTQASILFKNSKVLERYNDLHDRLIKEAEDECIISAKDVLRQLVDIVRTDTNEIVELRRCCCRYCWGLDHKYQFTPDEMRKAQERHAEKEKKAKKNSEEIPPFDYQGGDKYDQNKAINPKCPECFGQGIEIAFFHDTRNLSSAAKTLYAGLKTTKEGIEVKMQSKDKMIELLGRHLGMFKDKIEVDANINNLNPYAGLTTEELKKLIGSG